MKHQIRLFLAISVAGAIATLVFAHWIIPIVPAQQLVVSETPLKSRGYLVDTSACRIPDIDPFDSSIAKLVWRRGNLSCYGEPSITYEDGNFLRINWTTVNGYYKGDFKYCKYQPIKRGSTKSDFSFSYGNFHEPFNHDIEIKDEFIRIYCISKSNKTINTNFHSLIILKKAVETKCAQRFKRHLEINKPKELMNVVMVGIDSTSRLNFMRQMPRTRQYLVDDLEAVEMLGYTKVADNTFVNLIPLLTGKFVEELPWNETVRYLPFDKYSIIWKNFSRIGYRTLYAEDDPGVSAFTYLKAGFKETPTDHYSRMFSIALEKHKSVWNTNHHCVGDRLETEIVLKYFRDFSALYRNKPHFGFTFITRLTHDNINDAGAADEPHFRYLQRVHQEGLLKKTILIYFSDHGNRFGNFRNTYVGKLEERLPLFFFVFPKWFKVKYPSLIANMKKNSRRLTTPFDVYETLKDIVNFQGRAKPVSLSQRGISLFSEVPRDRSCDNAGILPHWCVCLNRESIPTSSRHVTEAADYMLRHINTELSHVRDKCANLTIKTIKEAVRMSFNSKVLKFKQSLNAVINRTVFYGKRADTVLTFQVTMETEPGEGLFEGTVKLDEKTKQYSLSGDISRINKYGDQSICIDSFILKKYCYCHHRS